MRIKIRKAMRRANRRGCNRPFGQGRAACRMHRRRAKGTQGRCSGIACHIKRVSLSVFSSGLGGVEVHALDTEFALSVQPERQPHHRPNHVVAPRILVAAPRLAMERLPKYLPHLPQCVF